MRRRGAVLGAVAGGLLLGGCSPADLPLAAVWLDAGGKPVVSVRPCGDDRVRRLSLSGSGDEGSDDTFWRTAGAGTGAVTFPLFSPPRSWKADRGGPQRLLTGRDYWLSGTVGQGENVDYRIVVTFAADDLTLLEPGQVWADERALSRDAFDELVDDKC